MGRIVVRRVLRDGERAEEVGFPPGWELHPVAADPPLPPLSEDDLPRPRSITIPVGRVLVVVNDAQRATPTAWLLGLLALDWRDPETRFVVATGSHLPPTGRGMREIFGERLADVADRVLVHRAAEDPLLSLGPTTRGTPVEVNACLEGSAVVALGSVEPHYFAGWTGGRKSVVPGLGSLATMRANHRLALEAGAAPGALAGNPVHLDLEEATGIVRDRVIGGGAPEPCAVNAVVCRGRVYGWHHGPLLGAVEALAPRGWEVFGRSIPGRFPLVLCWVDHPLDRDVYQALKAFENWKSAVAPGGILVVIADCPAGIGPPTFHQFTDPGLDLDALLRRAGADYRLGDHKAIGLLRHAAEGGHLWFVAPGLAGRGDLPLRVFESVPAALSAAHDMLPPAERRALVVEDAATLIPLAN